MRLTDHYLKSSAFSLLNQMMFWTVIIVVVVSIAVKREKKNFQHQVQPLPGANNINKNKDFVTTLKVMFFAIVLLLGPLLSAISPHLGNNVELKIVAYLLLHLSHPFITLIVIPVNILISKHDFRKFALGRTF